MKKNIFIAVVVTALVFATGCQKFDSLTEEVNNNSVVSNNEIVTKSTWGLNNVWSATYKTCISVPYDCFDEIVVLDNIQKIFRAIGEKPNPKELPLVIREHIYQEHLNAALKGNLKLSARFNEKTNYLYLIFSDRRSGKTVVVYQFTSKI
jgi:hypothetical protein